ncbi:MAG: TIM barrel protein [SAR202 cluster bacterium]|mgnify:FL=1|nr:TIM barrel protein [SAR202 cluster bacterium]OUU78006.1 MAG: mannonate dehydratase [Chloroflexi bacterium TMED70]RZP17438.1 MAG: mannonate dehydratase [Chloroflexota bacterium]|tara:strand:+ start:209 stop:1243 length:1035 start_codon:yes stop_codon:yes gene_type:complete
MYIGTQVAPRNLSDLEVWSQLGVKNICTDPFKENDEGEFSSINPHEWTEEILEKHVEIIEKNGLKLDMVQIPLSSRPLEESQSPNIMLGKSPERDKEIESIQKIIELCSKVGIPAVKYNMNIIGIPRSENEKGRGGSINSTFRWSKINQEENAGIAGVLDVDTNWERIDYFLERVVPVAEEFKVRLACHPHDPYTPNGYKGVTRVLGTVDGLKRFIGMHESDYHGLNFCQGTVSEMLEDPGKEIFDVIRYFGKRKKIFNVHFRNILGKKLDFMEVFPDEGSIDMIKALKAYQEVGYEYMLMPDHVPSISGPNKSGVAFAYCYGYITAGLQSINEPRDIPWTRKK